jgi:hypothetical protein
MTLDTKTSGFTQITIAFGPLMTELRHFEAGVDQTEDTWQMIAQTPGRYIIALACRGNGGGGEYTMTRKAIHAKEFGIGTPAKGAIAKGEVQIWKFTVKPGNPVLIHWNSSNWSYDVNIYGDKGEFANFQRDDVDANNKFGIITRPATYVIVLTGKSNATYSIDVGNIPGYKSAGALRSNPKVMVSRIAYETDA